MSGRFRILVVAVIVLFSGKAMGQNARVKLCQLVNELDAFCAQEQFSVDDVKNTPTDLSEKLKALEAKAFELRFNATMRPAYFQAAQRWLPAISDFRNELILTREFLQTVSEKKADLPDGAEKLEAIDRLNTSTVKAWLEELALLRLQEKYADLRTASRQLKKVFPPKWVSNDGTCNCQ